MRIAYISLLIMAVIIVFYGAFCSNNKNTVWVGVSCLSVATVLRMAFLKKRL